MKTNDVQNSRYWNRYHRTARGTPEKITAENDSQDASLIKDKEGTLDMNIPGVKEKMTRTIEVDQE